MPRSTLFGRRKHPKYSKIVQVTTPARARESVVELKREFSGAKTRAKKVRILRVTNQAANIAGVQAGQTFIPKVRQRKRVVQRIYRRAAKQMSRKLKR